MFKIVKRVELLDGIHCVIGEKYCQHNDEGYIDEFYINAVSKDDVEIYYNKETSKYSNFNEMISSKVFNGKSIIDLKNKIFLDN